MSEEVEEVPKADNLPKETPIMFKSEKPPGEFLGSVVFDCMSGAAVGIDVYQEIEKIHFHVGMTENIERHTVILEMFSRLMETMK